MKTFPGFTWEWIIEHCEEICDEVQKFIERETLYSHEAQKGYLQSAQGLIAIIPQLREHPQLGKLVPMMSLLSLRWFPADDYEVQLFCEENKSKYSITVIKGELDIKEKRIVTFTEVADKIYAYITKLNVE